MLYVAAVMNLLVGALLVSFCIFAAVVADQSTPPGFLLVTVVIFGTPGIFFLYWGIRAAADHRKTQEQMALQARREASAAAIAEVEAATIAKAEARRKAVAKAVAAVKAERAAEAEAEEEAEANFELRRIELRDADCQDIPYEYQCIGHPNVTLALRYGIANTSRSSAGEGRSIRENTAIRLQKIEKVQEDEAGAIYLAELPDFGGRKVKVVITPGTEFVQTFLPMSRTWFKEHEDLERLLKDNPTFTLKELATFHVQAVLNTKR